MATPEAVKHAVIGAGIHGLSTAYHLADALRTSGHGWGKDILVVDKTGIAAGASGIACGVVRNNYFQPAMRVLMVQCVEVLESDPKAYSYHPVGYMQISPESMHADVGSIYEHQKANGHESEFIEGEADCLSYMKCLFDDWQAKGITSVLHEKKGGYANNTAGIYGLATKSGAEGVRILIGAEVTGIEFASGSKAVSAIQTSKGRIDCQYVVVAPAPRVSRFWELLELPRSTSVKGRDGQRHDDVAMWKYWCLEEGTLGADPNLRKTNDGAKPPVLHVDSDAQLYADDDGSLITDQMWWKYYKPDFNFGGIEGGVTPYAVDQDPGQVAIDPYGSESPDFIVGDNFISMWCSALTRCQKRFEGKIRYYKNLDSSGGPGCFTPDSFPVFDVLRENVYFIADSNHGYKIIGVGKLVAQEILREQSAARAFPLFPLCRGKTPPGFHQSLPLELAAEPRNA